MTLKELSQLYYLTREIEADQKRLDELSRAASAPSTPNITGMPRAPHSDGSKTERLVAEIVDLQAIIAARRIQCIHERARLERWISEIPDSLTRQIFLYRFADCLSWVQVATRIGGGNNAGNVSERCYSYLRKTQENKGNSQSP